MITTSLQRTLSNNSLLVQREIHDNYLKLLLAQQEAYTKATPKGGGSILY